VPNKDSPFRGRDLKNDGFGSIIADMLSGKEPTMADSDKVVRRIRAATKKHFTSEEKIRIVLEGLRGQVPISTCVEGVW
jgi:hypothetical protein